MARTAAPSGGTDAVRRSLDAHAVDPESEDRPYLVSMLRRLGYTDAQIQDYLAGRQDPGAPAAAPAGQSVASSPPSEVSSAPLERHAEPEPAHTEPDHGEERDVEVEYTGPGLQDYRIVDPVDFFGDQNLVEFEPAPAQESWETATGEELGSDGQPLAEFTPAAEAEPAWEDVPAEATWETPADPATLAEAPSQEPAWEESAAPAETGMQVIQYGDYTLYQKEEVRDGHAARVYAFSKTPPGEGYEAATEVPEGYQVAENPETGRPFLRRTGEEDWGLAEAAGILPGGSEAGDGSGRRRVRLKRVRAANREEAMRLVEREGGTPLASVPIDIEKHLGDE
ncbi:MAG: hypothetical protein LC623_01290 [Halobacteriales archaeon]|nr:hypothetical protein [Halobacteriales archaeon]